MDEKNNYIRQLPTPNNHNELFHQLISGNLVLNPLWQKGAYRCKFWLRSYVFYPKTRRWLEQLAHYPQLMTFLARQSNLPCKLQRPYLINGLNSQQRLDLLTYHYNFISKQSETLIHTFYADTPYLLATLTTKNNHSFFITIESTDKFSREGELTIKFVNQANSGLANLTFSIINDQNKPTLFIGGFQGTNSSTGRDEIRQATKACFHLFPKRIVIETARAIALFFNISQIMAVSNKTHIYSSIRYFRRKKRVYCDYDSYWLSLGGEQNDQQLFTLPIKSQHKPIENIASKKRAEYRNRYALLDSLHKQITTQLERLVK